ncbi:MAG: hypothetical protein R2700_15765 [Solirubrobacterales bacterium]
MQCSGTPVAWLADLLRHLPLRHYVVTLELGVPGEGWGFCSS